MTTHTPERSLQQRMDALERANQIRIRRAHFKRDLKLGRISAHAYLLDPPEWLCTMKIFDLLMATPKIGRVKAHRALKYLRVSPSKTVGGLSPRQRMEIVSFLR